MYWRGYCTPIPFSSFVIDYWLYKCVLTWSFLKAEKQLNVGSLLGYLFCSTDLCVFFCVPVSYCCDHCSFVTLYFGHLMWRVDLSEKTLLLGKTEGRRKRAWQRIRCLDSIADSMNMSLSIFWEVVKDREAWCVLQPLGSQRVGHDLGTKQQQKWAL